jgi:hypothetical protein
MERLDAANQLDSRIALRHVSENMGISILKGMRPLRTPAS